jgi:hypothetical protein
MAKYLPPKVEQVVFCRMSPLQVRGLAVWEPLWHPVGAVKYVLNESPTFSSLLVQIYEGLAL